MSGISKTTAKLSPEELRELLHLFREESGIRLVKLGKRARVSQPMLSQFENGKENLSQESRDRVLDAMEQLLVERGKRLKARIAKLEKKTQEEKKIERWFWAGLGADLDLGEAPRGIRAALRSPGFVLAKLEEKKSLVARVKQCYEDAENLDGPLTREVIDSLRKDIALLEEQKEALEERLATR